MSDRIASDVQFGVVPTWLLLSGVSGHAVHVYAVLWGVHAHGATGKGAWPGRALLASECGVATKTIDRAIEELKAAGALRTEPRYDRRGRTSNAYILVLTTPQTLQVVDTSDDHPSVVDTGDQGVVDTRVQGTRPRRTRQVRPTVRERAKEEPTEYGKDAREAVGVYCDARKAAGLPTDRAECGKLARHLIACRRDGWSQDLCFEAARAFAASKRAVVYFHEWVASVFNAQGAAEHAALKAEPFDRDAFLALLTKAHAEAERGAILAPRVN